MATTISPTSCEDEPPLQDDPSLSSRFGPRSYCVLCFLVDGSISALAVVIWSNSLGMGPSAYAALGAFAWLRKWCFGMCFLVLAGLYLLDFFWPPHLPGQILTLWDGDTCLGRLLLCTAGFFLALALLLLTPVFPSLPLVLTISLSPVCVGVLRMIVGPGGGLPKGGRMDEIVEGEDDESKVQLLMSIVGQEHDTLSFFKAAMAAFLTSSLVTLMLWVVYGVVLKRGLEEELERAEDGHERDEVYVQWAAPLVVSVSNLVFALFAFLRICMQRTYIATDVCRNRLLAQTMMMPTTARPDLQQWRLSAFTKVDLGHLATQRDSYLTRHKQNVKQLSLLVKVVGCAFALLICLLVTVVQFLYADSHIAVMVLTLTAALFMLFILFVWVTFGRVVCAIGKWLHELPVWRTAAAVTEWPLTRAFLICPLLPVVPLVLLVSMLNQLVRRWRGLLPQPLLRGLLTPRVAAAVDCVQTWDRLAICTWCYVLCAIYVCFTICPLCLNVSLSWLRNASASWPFAVVVSLTFVLGVVLFLLPPVPGMTVYIFGGLVISGTCPPAGTVRGFWTGTVLNIGMCWVLKLAACAVQQKCIGGMLGRSRWVRRTVGVHRMTIRCVEAELKVPGFTVGKVAILCGGPDWPTSVLAGVLGLSLWQCELGTVPIIGVVAPCAMTGSLYIKRDEGEVWSRAAQLMIIASVVVNLLLWGLAFWAIQNRMEADYEELSRPLPENVDLHWLDHRDEHLAKRTHVSWAGTPPLVRRLYMLGAVAHVLTCHVLNWGHSRLFGDFAVQDDINTLVLLPRADSQGGELLTYTSLLVLVAYVLAFAFPTQFFLWKRHCVAPVRRSVAMELDMLEREWKDAFLRGLKCDRSAERVELGKSESFQVEDKRSAGCMEPSLTSSDVDSKAGEPQLKAACKGDDEDVCSDGNAPTVTLPYVSSDLGSSALGSEFKAAASQQEAEGGRGAEQAEHFVTSPPCSSDFDSSMLEPDTTDAFQCHVEDEGRSVGSHDPAMPLVDEGGKSPGEGVPPDEQGGNPRYLMPVVMPEAPAPPPSQPRRVSKRAKARPVALHPARWRRAPDG